MKCSRQQMESRTGDHIQGGDPSGNRGCDDAEKRWDPDGHGDAEGL